MLLRTVLHHYKVATNSLLVKLTTNYKGESAVCFETDEIAGLVVPFNPCLVGKFAYVKPSMENL